MRIKLQYQVFGSIIAVVMVVIVALGTVSARRASRIVQDQTSLALSDALRQASTNIEHLLDQARVVGDSIAGNPNVVEILTTIKDGRYDLAYLLDGFRYLISILSLAESGPQIHRVRLFIFGDSLLGRNRSYLFNATEWETEAFPDGSPYVAQRWLPTYGAEYPFTDRPERVFSLRRPLFSDESRRDMVGVLSIDLRESVLEEMLSEVSRFQAGLLAVHTDHVFVASVPLGTRPDPDVGSAQLLDTLNEVSAGATYQLVSIAGVEYVAIVQHLNVSFADWRLSALIPQQAISGLSREIRAFTYTLVVAAIVLAAVVAGVLSRGITRGLTQLYLRIHDVGKGTYEPIPDVSGPAEIVELQHQYNEMAAEIRTLIEQVYENRIQRHEAELKALEGQINPHFLYNTLDTIKWMAIREKQRRIADLVEALSSFFRISLSKGEVLIPLKDEIEHVRAYVRIQNYRFQDRLQTHFDIPAALERHVVLKLLLQPLVENAIVHGIQKRADLAGTISISARIAAAARGGEDARLELSVTDDGVGMTQEQIDRLMTHQSDGYAVKNIEQRIQLYHGAAYGLSFASAPGRGTTVTVELPVAWSEPRSAG